VCSAQRLTKTNVKILRHIYCLHKIFSSVVNYRYTCISNKHQFQACIYLFLKPEILTSSRTDYYDCIWFTLGLDRFLQHWLNFLFASAEYENMRTVTIWNCWTPSNWNNSLNMFYNVSFSHLPSLYRCKVLLSYNKMSWLAIDVAILPTQIKVSALIKNKF
jgi:hypothetical protein